MARPKRRWLSQEVGSYHIISKVAGGYFLFNETDKEYLLSQLERFASGYFVQIHAFAIMSNHIHVLATCMNEDAKRATKKELERRYKLIYPKLPGPPEGKYDSGSGQLIPDEDGGTERLRERLGSISRFVQEYKQSVSRWYNKKYNRKGYLWGDRFKGIAVSKGEAQLTCSAYIDLNPIRANIVKRPEDYRWSSLGLRVRSPKRAKNFLFPLSVLPTGDEMFEPEGDVKSETSCFRPLLLKLPVGKAWDHYSTYREFVYQSGAVERKGCASIHPELVRDVVDYHGNLGIGDLLCYRVRNISEGLAFGNYALIAHIQKLFNRKYIRPRSFMPRERNCSWSFTTRVLRL